MLHSLPVSAWAVLSEAWESCMSLSRGVSSGEYPILVQLASSGLECLVSHPVERQTGSSFKWISDLVPVKWSAVGAIHLSSSSSGFQLSFKWTSALVPVRWNSASAVGTSHEPSLFYFGFQSTPRAASVYLVWSWVALTSWSTPKSGTEYPIGYSGPLSSGFLILTHPPLPQIGSSFKWISALVPVKWNSASAVGTSQEPSLFCFGFQSIPRAASVYLVWSWVALTSWSTPKSGTEYPIGYSGPLSSGFLILTQPPDPQIGSSLICNSLLVARVETLDGAADFFNLAAGAVTFNSWPSVVSASFKCCWESLISLSKPRFGTG